MQTEALKKHNKRDCNGNPFYVTLSEVEAHKKIEVQSPTNVRKSFNIAFQKF